MAAPPRQQPIFKQELAVPTTSLSNMYRLQFPDSDMVNLTRGMDARARMKNAAG
jgi:hypothetical protein